MKKEEWEIVEFSWGVAVRQVGGSWVSVSFRPSGQTVDVEGLPVIMNEHGIQFLKPTEYVN